MNQINCEFWDYILFLLNNAKEYTQSEKNEIIEDICEYYYKQSGGFAPPSEMLYAMGDFLLDNILSDTNVDKVRDSEYPILSYKQRMLRKRREISEEGEILDFVTTKRKYNIATPKNTDDRKKEKR